MLVAGERVLATVALDGAVIDFDEEDLGTHLARSPQSIAEVLGLELEELEETQLSQSRTQQWEQDCEQRRTREDPVPAAVEEELMHG